MSKANNITPPDASNPIVLPAVDLREQLRKTLTVLNVGVSTVARQLGLAKSTLHNWLSGKRKNKRGDSSQLEANVAEWLAQHPLPAEPEPVEDDEDEGPIDGSPGPGDFAITPISETIWHAFAHAQKNADMVCVFGPPGVGKTATIGDYVDDREGDAWCATMSPSSSGLCQAIEVVAHAVGLKHASGGARRLRDAIIVRIKGRKGLLIVDEAQHLSMAAVEELRAIHDATGVGLALVGNEQSYTRFLGGSHAANYAQINSRIGLKLKIGKPERKDVAAIAATYGVTDRDCIDLLMRVASRPGSLRAVVKMLKLCVSGHVKIDILSLTAARDMIGAEA
jgi:hypothetical protein